MPLFQADSIKLQRKTWLLHPVYYDKDGNQVADIPVSAGDEILR